MTSLEAAIEYDRLEQWKLAEAQAAARDAFDNEFAVHQCYWNDRLYLALTFNLDRERRNESLRRVADNGRTGYFEPRTHHDFNLRNSLIAQGIPAEELPLPSPDRAGVDYRRLDERTIERIERLIA